MSRTRPAKRLGSFDATLIVMGGIFFAGVAFPRDSVIGLVIFLSGAPIFLLWRRRASAAASPLAAPDVS